MRRTEEEELAEAWLDQLDPATTPAKDADEHLRQLLDSEEPE